MDSTNKIWVGLDTNKGRALAIASAIAEHPAVKGFKINRLVDQEVFRKSNSNEPALFDRLHELGKPIWVDLKFHDIPETVKGRVEPYVTSGMVQYLTVMAKGGLDMMKAAIDTAGNYTHIIAVTELTSLIEEEVHLGSGQPTKASVLQLARNAVLTGLKHLVCSGLELEVLANRFELQCLEKFVPAISPVWSLTGAGKDQKRTAIPEFVLKNGGTAMVIARAIVNADDPLEAVKKTAAEIEAIA